MISFLPIPLRSFVLFHERLGFSPKGVYRSCCFSIDSSSESLLQARQCMGQIQLKLRPAYLVCPILDSCSLLYLPAAAQKAMESPTSNSQDSSHNKSHLPVQLFRPILRFTCLRARYCLQSCPLCRTPLHRLPRGDCRGVQHL